MALLTVSHSVWRSKDVAGQARHSLEVVNSGDPGPWRGQETYLTELRARCNVTRKDCSSTLIPTQELSYAACAAANMAGDCEHDSPFLAGTSIVASPAQNAFRNVEAREVKDAASDSEEQWFQSPSPTRTRHRTSSFAPNPQNERYRAAVMVQAGLHPSNLERYK